MTATRTRYRRQRVTRADGSVAVQSKPPRADVLYHPRTGWTTVLVRRTHDIELARAMAERRWQDVADDRPLAQACRVGWWRTTGRARLVDAAEDASGRGVMFTRNDRDPAAGPGVEFRPETAEETRLREEAAR
ncbi:hypothetical protein DMP17_22100 [Pseudonocardia sp. TMWB2A]|uniref:hypothetical protein n=1 Tax=Pseudonocardia sp. TMWB2A TaxID=687430 RepID=UPI00307FA351